MISADVVTADGKVLVASADENEDLFWALRGGGGNFGVVTSFEFQLHPVDMVYGGPIFYEVEHARALFQFYRNFIEDAPLEFGGFPAWQVAPPLPFIPENRVGDTFCAAVVHWAGPIEQAERVIKGFRDVAPIVAEHVGPMPYPALNGAFDGLFPKGIRSYWKGSFANDLPDAAIDAHLAHGPTVPSPSATMHLYPINGACHDVGPKQTAFPYRRTTYAAVYLAAWDDPKDDEARIKWVRDYYHATAPYSESAGYINFMHDDDRGKTQENYAQNYPRLAKVKKSYDPNNLFHINQNIEPE